MTESISESDYQEVVGSRIHEIYEFVCPFCGKSVFFDMEGQDFLVEACYECEKEFKARKPYKKSIREV